jgi:uncharacterized repeat protein (TIGR03803 family)
MRSTISTAIAVAAIIGVGSAGQAAAASKYAVLHAFTGGNDGGFPHAGVIADSTGALYGTTSSGGVDHSGVVYKLTPPAAGKKAWKQETLYSFTGANDGQTPYSALLMDSSGALYGTTLSGGSSGQGVVYKLTPPAAGQKAWTESVLWTFTGGNDGGAPWSPLSADSKGNLYGTATQGGTGVVGIVFKLSPPAAGKTAWTEKVAYNFTGNSDGGEPTGSVLVGSDGTLYGTTAGYGADNYGTVYSLTPPKKGSTAYSFNLLWTFANKKDGEVPRDGLITDGTGALYGTTAGFDTSYGTVFKLTPPASGQTAWTLNTLTTFTGVSFTGNGPWQTVSMDAAGALYGTTYGDGRTAYGNVFKLTPPVAGSTKWKRTTLYQFPGLPKAEFPFSTVLVGSGGTLFGTSYGSAGQSGFYPGNVWQITQ